MSRTVEQPALRFFLALVIVATFLLGLVTMPIVKEFLLAVGLAGMLWPVQQWSSKRLRVGGASPRGCSRSRSSRCP